MENGKFMRGKEEVAPVIGNREQIDLLRRVEREMDERERLARGGKLDVEVGVEDITYYVRCVFTCICGHRSVMRMRWRRSTMTECMTPTSNVRSVADGTKSMAAKPN